MPPILMYHQVAADPPAAYGHYTVTPAMFARQMRLLASLGYRTVSLDAVADSFAGAGRLPSRAVAITFDDGFADAVRHAAPVLARCGFTATFFAVAGLVGGTSEWTRRRRGIEMPLADAGALREMAAAGFTIGSHALTHRRLTEVGESECRYELRDSKRRLEDATGQEVRHLAYPYGAVDEGVRAAAWDSGYTTACSIREALAGPADDVLMLPRVHVTGGDSLAGFLYRVRRGRPFRNVLHRVRETMKVSAFVR